MGSMRGKGEKTKEIRVHVRMSGSLADHIAACTGPEGLYENTGEYIRDLVRRDIEGRHKSDFRTLWAHLLPGILADEDAFEQLSADDLIRFAKEQIKTI